MGKTRRVVIFLALWLAGVAFAGPYEALEQVVGQASDFSDFLARPDLVAAYKKALQTYYGQSKFQCESFEDILARLVRLNAEVPGFGAELWKSSEAESLVAFKANEGATSTRERWELAPVPRKLHAIWNDPSQRGCVSQDCGKAEVTAPERWAVALPGSRTYLLHRENKFSGAGLLVMSVSKGKQSFSLFTQTGAAFLKDQASYAASESGSASVSTLYDQFVDRFTERKEGGEAVVVQYDPKALSLGKMTRVRSGKGRRAFVGFLDEFRPTDAMATGVARAMPRKCFARKGKEAINLFAGFGTLGGGASPGIFWGPGAVRDLLVQVGNPNNLSTMPAVPPEQKGEVGKTLADLMAEDPDAVLREKAALALRLLGSDNSNEDGVKEPGLDAARSPASATKPASASEPRRGVASKEFAPAFRKALSDPSPGVRGVAASALAAGGDRSSQVASALNEALNASGPTSAGLSAGQLAGIAAEGQNQGGLPITQGSFGSLLDRATQEAEAAAHKKLVDELARGLLASGDPNLRNLLEDRARTDPKLVNEIADRLNENGPKICTDKEDREKAVEQERRERGANTERAANQTVAAGEDLVGGAAGKAAPESVGSSISRTVQMSEAAGAEAARRKGKGIKK